jgi:hypothetical protein
MDKYYYFASQLPLLKFNEKTYMNRELFLAEGQKWLEEKEFLILSSANLNDFLVKNQDSGILRRYKDFEKTLRQELVLFRQVNKEEAEYKPSGALGQHTLEGTPLEIEVKLILLRWKFIEELEAEHYFDLEFLIFYYLKLQILERLFRFDKEKGIVIFDQLCEVNPVREKSSIGLISNGVNL